MKRHLLAIAAVMAGCLPEYMPVVVAIVRAMCQPELGWSDARWETSQAAYLALWNAHYSLPT